MGWLPVVRFLVSVIKRGMKRITGMQGKQYS